MRNARLHTWTTLVLAAGVAAGCSSSTHPTGSGDPGPIIGGEADVGQPAPILDAGAPDSGAIEFGTPGPWPTAPVTLFGRAAGLLESAIVDVSTDEAQDIWAVSAAALYLLKPGETQFRRYAAADGLHLADAMPPGITAVVGGASGEAFVGYAGADIEDTQNDPLRTKGKLDRVVLTPAGTLQVTHHDVHNNDAVGFDSAGNVIKAADGCPDPQYTDWSYNEDRTVKRFLYDHLYHRGALYVGYNHGVARFSAGHPDPTTCFEYADHIHPVVINSEHTPRMGDWSALALDPSERANKDGVKQRGMLWMGGRWAAGAAQWTPALFDWARNERNPLWVALIDPPVFEVTPGDSIYLQGIAPLSDGTVYLASGVGNTAGYAPRGIARWTSRAGLSYLSPWDLGLPSGAIVDFQRLPDDTILVALAGQGLWHWNPKPEPRGQMLGKVAGLPTENVTRVYVDPMVDPPAVYVATTNGFALLRLPPAGP